MASDPRRAEGSPQTRLDISFPADVARIGGVVEQVVRLTHELHGDTGKEQEIALALTEALANAVKHGSKNNPSLEVRCWVRTTPSTMVITVRDRGPGFDPRRVPNPLENARLSADHGRGLHLIRQLMDEVHFARNGAEIQMTKKF